MSRYVGRFNTGDLITATGRERLMVYRHDFSALKYTLFNLNTKEATYEPKLHVDENYIKIGVVDVETIKVLFL